MRYWTAGCAARGDDALRTPEPVPVVIHLGDVFPVKSHRKVVW